MTINSVDEANRIGKEWLSREYGVATGSITTVSCMRTGTVWNVVLSFYSFSEPKKYQVIISDDGNVIKTQQLGNAVNQRAMGSAPTLVLIAMILSILVIIGFGFYSIALLAIIVAPIPFPFVALLGLIPLAFLVIGIGVLLRILTIRKFIESGDAKSAYEADSVAFGIVALIFNGLISGILLLVARDDLRRAAEQESPDTLV
ncbi:MAG: hypothetical protein ACYCT2_03910 [Thermoplasmataceae archaeon]